MKLKDTIQTISLVLFMCIGGFSIYKAAILLKDNSQSAAKCKSIGGSFGGTKCYINGEIVDLEK